jgi:hypothetical protein
MTVRILLILFLPLTLAAQSSYAPLNEDYYHLVQRYEIKTGRILPQLFTSLRQYKRSGIVAMIDSAKSFDVFESKADQFNYDYLMNDNWEWSNAATADSKKPILRHFYRKKSDLFSYHDKDFDLHVNPVLYLGVGKDSRLDDGLFINTRGIEVRGMIDNRVGFYTYVADNQAVLPAYVHEYVQQKSVIPHEGFWKDYKEGKGVDFLQARGYVTYDASKHIHFQLGHDRFFIGNGYRSLALSDFSSPALFFRANVKVWKLNYQFLLNQMIADVDGNIGGLKSRQGGYPHKFMALHHVSINIGKKFNLGIFESVVFSADDSLGADHLRLDYFNPIVSYRAVEQQNGSSDNVLLGMDFKLNALRDFQVYGQFILDEFVIDEIRAGDGWWGNKFGFQIGGKYIDAFTVPNLDLQGEINVMRPYTYSHGSNYGSYTHYRQPIAHALGANFKEAIGIARYQPLPRLMLTGKLIFINIGKDDPSVPNVNWGSDPFKNSSLRPQTYGNEIGQGVSTKIIYGDFMATWQVRHNIFIDGSVLLRKSDSDHPFYNNNSSITSLALRWNIAKRQYDF